MQNILIRKTAWDSVFRLRIGLGWTVKKILGNYSIRYSPDLLSIPNLTEGINLQYEFEFSPNNSFNTHYFTIQVC